MIYYNNIQNSYLIIDDVVIVCKFFLQQSVEKIIKTKISKKKFKSHSHTSTV